MSKKKTSKIETSCGGCIPSPDPREGKTLEEYVTEECHRQLTHAHNRLARLSALPEAVRKMPCADLGAVGIYI